MADIIAPREESADEEIPSSATGGADGACGVKASVTSCETGTESGMKKSSVVTVVYSNRASKKSKSRRKTSLSRPQRRKRGTSGNVENGDAAPSAQVTSKKQERRDDASTKKRISVVHRALSDPDLLTPVEVDRLVRVVFWKAIHDDDSAEPAAKFCARVITAELDGVFIDRLLWTCRVWFKEHDVPLRRSTARAQWKPPPQQEAVNQLTALVVFMAVLLSSIPGKGTAAYVGSCHSGHIFCIAALLCDSCKLVLRSPELDHHTKVECLRRALTTAGEAAERGAPARMAALVDCLRDAFLSPDVPEDDRLTLLELIELRASGWKLSPEQQISYASLNDAVGDECDDVQNLSPLPWRIAE
ncbi:MIF4G domain-containing protein B-like [Rhipicephalus microplus]|uniref:MIF4G domain-containing protein B-like n=1 Tax=Rhipicephalus microplus TaxID=6941 RepID=UPI003F6C1C1C